MSHRLVTLSLFFLLAASSFGVAEEQRVDAGGGVSTGTNAGGEGLDAYVTPHAWRAYVDPGLLDAFEFDLTQVAILVLEPTFESSALDAVSRLGLDHHFYDRLHMVSVVLPFDFLDDVVEIPGVLTIHPNETMKPTLDQSAEYVGAKTVWNLYRTTGAGVTVLVVDSGVDGTHPDVRYGENLIENVIPTRQASGLVGGAKEGVVTSDADGHGTHVAGIVGGTAKALGTSEAGKYRGIAYNSRLIGFQAGITDPASGEVSFESVTVLEAFNYAIANRDRYGIRIVTNSWGTNGEFDPKNPVNVATLNMYKAGLAVFFAAGNEGEQGYHTLNKYAVAPWVLGVGAGDYLNQVPNFSSRGSDPARSRLPYDHPDLIAPGAGITSARAATSAGDALGSGTSATTLYATKSGSSMATPHAAGVAALLLEANPKLSPDDLYDILTATATPMPRYHVWEAGAGYVNALQAYQLGRKTTGGRDAFLQGHVKYAGPASGDPDYADDAVTVGYERGAAVALREPDKSVGEFTKELVGTIHGIVFLVGTAVLASLAFGFGRRSPGANPSSRGAPRAPAPPTRVDSCSSSIR